MPKQNESLLLFSFFPGKPFKNAKYFSSNSPKGTILKKKKVDPIIHTNCIGKKMKIQGRLDEWPVIANYKRIAHFAAL